MKLIKTKLNGLNFCYRADDKYVGQRIALGKYEEYESMLMISQINTNSVVVDVGANIGYYTLLLAEKCKKVYAFEPDKECFEILKKNVGENKLKNVEIYNKAVGNENNKVGIVRDKKNFGNSRVKKGKEMDCVKLDDVIKEPINLIKIDTQGWEPQVIEGTKKIIKRDSPILFLEYTPSSYKDNSMINYLRKIYKNIWSIDYWFYVCKKGIQINSKTGYVDLFLTNKKISFWNRYKNVQWKKILKWIATSPLSGGSSQ